MKWRRRPPFVLSVTWNDHKGSQRFQLARRDKLIIRGDLGGSGPVLKAEYLDSGELSITQLAPFLHVPPDVVRWLASQDAP